MRLSVLDAHAYDRGEKTIVCARARATRNATRWDNGKRLTSIEILPFLVKPLSQTAEIPGRGRVYTRPERNARVFVAAWHACTKTGRAMYSRVSGAISVSRRSCTASIGHR